jgi:uncharacterized membrane protein (UPF0127 family)
MTYHTKMLVSFPRTGATVLADVATDEAAKLRGLHGRTSLGPNEGMLFRFSPQRPPIAMTMEKMLIPLDFIFIGADMAEGLAIAHIAHRVRAGRSAPVLGPAVPWVLEVPFGFARRHRLVCGDEAQFWTGG